MSCLETSVTLRIFSASMTPSAISKVLSVNATDSRLAMPGNQQQTGRVRHYWSWCSRAALSSAAEEEHWAALLDLLDRKKDQIDYLKSRGCEMDICCFYVFSEPGGPSLNARLLRSIAELDIKIWWDIYTSDTEVYG